MNEPGAAQTAPALADPDERIDMDHPTCTECGHPCPGRRTVTCSHTCEVLRATRIRREDPAKHAANIERKRLYNATKRPRRVGRWKRRKAEMRLARAAVGTTSRRTWTAGPCQGCGTPTVWFATLTLCDPCRQRSTTARRYERKKARDKRRREVIFERDGWICWICQLPVDRRLATGDPLAPSVDHVHPQAHDGTDDAWNLRCAHRICNSRRGAPTPPGDTP